MVHMCKAFRSKSGGILDGSMQKAGFYGGGGGARAEINSSKWQLANL